MQRRHFFHPFTFTWQRKKIVFWPKIVLQLNLTEKLELIMHTFLGISCFSLIELRFEI